MNKLYKSYKTDKPMNASRRAFLTGKRVAEAEGELLSGPLIAKIGNRCFAIDSVACQICGDSCEEQAIKFFWTSKKVPMPNISEEDCTGCGDCLSVCPPNATTLIPSNKKIKVGTDAK